ncbi:hypothetical protein M2432_001266 [Mycobacterium sp. OTB74]|nr:hypothetical protein [Mycobacterium sp. OTB74]
MLTRMWGQHHPTGVADKAQAQYYRAFLEQKKSELEELLAVQALRLTMCTNGGELTSISQARVAISKTVGDLGAIDRMLRALGRRFPDEKELRRRA